MKWVIPALASGSSRAPAPIQKPSATERTLGHVLGDHALTRVQLGEDVVLHRVGMLTPSAAAQAQGRSWIGTGSVSTWTASCTR